MCANISHSYEYGYTAGKLAADWLNTNCSASQTVACALLTKPQSLAVIDRANGIIEGLRENCTFAQIVATKPYSDQASVREMTEQMMREHPEIRCMNLLNEEMCLVGIDASAPVLKKIQEGTVIRGSVSQDTKGFAEVTIHAAIAAIQGNPLPESSIKIEAVTMENVAAYLQAEAASHSTPAS